MAKLETLPNPILDSGQFREYVQNEDLVHIEQFYERCIALAENLKDSKKSKEKKLYEKYKNPTFLLTMRNSDNKIPLHIVILLSTIGC